MIGLTIALIISSAVLAGFLLIKAVKKKDMTILGGVFARIYLVIMATLYLFNVTPVHSNWVHIGILLVFLTDIFNNIVYFATTKYRTEIELNRISKILYDLTEKYTTIVESPILGFYIVNHEHLVEFVNGKLCKELGYTFNEFINMPVYKLAYDKQTRDGMKKHLDSKFSGEILASTARMTLRHKDGHPIKATLYSGRTYNGHPTVTGMVVFGEV